MGFLLTHYLLTEIRFLLFRREETEAESLELRVGTATISSETSSSIASPEWRCWGRERARLQERSLDVSVTTTADEAAAEDEAAFGGGPQSDEPDE